MLPSLRFSLSGMVRDRGNNNDTFVEPTLKQDNGQIPDRALKIVWVFLFFFFARDRDRCGPPIP